MTELQGKPDRSTTTMGDFNMTLLIIENPTQIPAGLFQIGKIVLKCVWKCQGPKIAKKTLKKNKVGKLTLSDLNLVKSYSN